MNTSGSTKTVAATLLRPDNEFMVSLAEIDADEDPKEANDLLDRACVVITDLANQVVALQQPSEPETRSIAARVADADARASSYLADANEARDKGKVAKAEKLEAKCQFWLDRSNKLRGCGP